MIQIRTMKIVYTKDDGSKFISKEIINAEIAPIILHINNGESTGLKDTKSLQT